MLQLKAAHGGIYRQYKYWTSWWKKKKKEYTELGEQEMGEGNGYKLGRKWTWSKHLIWNLKELILKRDKNIIWFNGKNVNFQIQCTQMPRMAYDFFSILNIRSLINNSVLFYLCLYKNITLELHLGTRTVKRSIIQFYLLQQSKEMDIKFQKWIYLPKIKM